MEMKSTPSIQGPRDWRVLRDLCGAQVEAEEINFYGGKEMIIYRSTLHGISYKQTRIQILYDLKLFSILLWGLQGLNLEFPVDLYLMQL